jgi:2-polyprenyl-3-methyl-5-hydroxy-6-metoxy-1,4-benzoquinol methylase
MTAGIDPEGNETRAIHALVDFRGKDILEIGCGDGRLTWRYADFGSTVVGLDPFESDIEQAQRNTPHRLRSRVRFQCGDALTVDFDPESFDVIVFGRSI